MDRIIFVFKKSLIVGKRIIVTYLSLIRPFGVGYATWNLLWSISYHIYGFNGCISNYLFKKTHKGICSYIEKKFHAVIQQIVIYDEKKTQITDYPIWFFWHQGIENAPDIVKACYDRIISIHGGDVHLITADNIQSYIVFPNYILQKVHAGIISLTHFSDLLRVSLLAKYGGIWVDSTCYVTEIDTMTRHYPLYSVKTDNNSFHRSWCLGSCMCNYPLFIFLRNIWLEYWKNENVLINYLMTDHLIIYAHDNFPLVKRDFDALPVNNVNRSSLYALLNLPFDLLKWSNIATDTWLFKLSYKGFFFPHTKDGEITFYGKMLANALPYEIKGK